MTNVLYLVHRLPYPPDKGDKVRSYHVLRHLLQNHRVFLGTFLDDLDDEKHLPTLRTLCPDLYVERINPRLAKVMSLAGLLKGEPLTVSYYRSAGMQRWVEEVVAAHPMLASVVFSSAMAQYAQPLLPSTPMVVDFVDVDSAKWTQYAPQHRWPLSMLYRREGRRLFAYERKVAALALKSYFATPHETALFLKQAPECTGRVESLSNGVDSDFFAPARDRLSPFASREQAIVFTGAMDYWPNVDAVSWFVSDILPKLRRRWPRSRFYIVGRNPTAQVRALACEHVVVTGTVPDVRPYLQHSTAVVAPLRIARGIQNKILEAMAIARAVVSTSSCADAIGASSAQGLLRADTPDQFIAVLQPLLDQPEFASALGRSARKYVGENFSWNAHLKGIDVCLSAGLNEVGVTHA